MCKKGTKFVVCGHEKLMDLGWWEDDDDEHYYHDDFRACSITFKMIDEYEGKTLTVTGKDPLEWNDFSLQIHGDPGQYSHIWYTVAENKYVWPVGIFLNHTCEEGMIPIAGWFICKTCGDNLRTLK